MKYEVASGDKIPNLGEKHVKVKTREGVSKSCVFQVAEVTQPLASVKAMTAAGHTVVFDSRGSYALDKRTGWWTMFREQGNAYYMDLQLQPKSGF